MNPLGLHPHWQYAAVGTHLAALQRVLVGDLGPAELCARERRRQSKRAEQRCGAGVLPGCCHPAHLRACLQAVETDGAEGLQAPEF